MPQILFHDENKGEKGRKKGKRTNSPAPSLWSRPCWHHGSHNMTRTPTYPMKQSHLRRKINQPYKIHKNTQKNKEERKEGRKKGKYKKKKQKKKKRREKGGKKEKGRRGKKEKRKKETPYSDIHYTAYMYRITISKIFFHLSSSTPCLKSYSIMKIRGKKKKKKGKRKTPPHPLSDHAHVGTTALTTWRTLPHIPWNNPIYAEK